MTYVDSDATRHVDTALHEVLGYLPSPDEDLTGAIDSMQKLELLIALEESLSIPFEDEALAAEWWTSRKAIVSYVRDALRGLAPAEPDPVAHLPGPDTAG